MGFPQLRRERERGRVSAPYWESLELARSQRKIQQWFQFFQYLVIVGLAGCGFGILALRPRPTHLLPDLFLWTGVPFLAGFIAQLFRLYRREADELKKLRKRELNIQLHANQTVLEQEKSERRIYRDSSLDLEASERLKALIFEPEPEPVVAPQSTEELKDERQRALPFPKRK